MRKAVRYIFNVMVLLPLLAAAQEFDDDARLWLYLKLDKKITKHWHAHFLLQNRLDNNVTEYSQAYGDLGVSYYINKNIRILADYVYGYKRRIDGSYSRKHQAYAGMVLKKHFGNVVLTYRNLVQEQMTDVYTSEKGMLPVIYDRNKLTVKYEINQRWECYTAEELNFPFNKNAGSGLYVSRTRTFAGIVYNLNKRSSIEAYFLFQRKFKFRSQPGRDFVYGFTYSYSF